MGAHVETGRLTMYHNGVTDYMAPWFIITTFSGVSRDFVGRFIGSMPSVDKLYIKNDSPKGALTPG